MDNTGIVEKKGIHVFFNNKKVQVLLKRLLIILLVFLIFLVFFNKLMSFVITVALVVIASFSKIYKRLIHSIGFELVTFAAIIFFYAYGPMVGFLLALLMLIASTLLSSKITQILTFQAIIYAIMAVISIFLKAGNVDIVSAGKVLVVVYNILLHFVGIFIIHYPLPSSIVNFVVNVVTNFFFFDWFGNWLISHL